MYLSSKNKVMFKILKNWHFHKLTETTMEIAKGNQSFSSTYFEDPEKLKQLSNFCQEFFQRNIKVRIIGNSHSFPQKQPSDSAEKRKPKAKVQSDLPTPVQDILHMFQGEIIEEYPANKAGVENTSRPKNIRR